jgi:hypothetical protein
MTSVFSSARSAIELFRKSPSGYRERGLLAFGVLGRELGLELLWYELSLLSGDGLEG